MTTQMPQACRQGHNCSSAINRPPHAQKAVIFHSQQAPRRLWQSCRHSLLLWGRSIGCDVEAPTSLLATGAAAAAVIPLAAALPWTARQLTDYLKPRKCQTCWGAGYYPCPVCHGRGKIGGILAEAPAAVACSNCQHGRVHCQACGRTGLANSWLWSPSSDPGWGARGEHYLRDSRPSPAGPPVSAAAVNHSKGSVAQAGCLAEPWLPAPGRRRQGRMMSSTGALPELTASFLSTVPWPVTVLGAAGLALTAIAFWDAARKTEYPKVQYPTANAASLAELDFHRTVISKCPSISKKPYRPIPFLTNTHVETIFAAKMRKCPSMQYIRECLLMPDGGCVALDWEHKPEPDKVLPADTPVLLLLPGLTGGSHDSYVVYAVQRAAKCGMRAVVFNSRATSDSPVTTPQYYSASFTGDMHAVVAHVHQRYPHAPLLTVGWSLGANIMVRYLGEEGPNTPVCAAASLCNPFELTISNANLTRGFNKVYDRNLANSLKAIHNKHAKLWVGVEGKFKPDVASTCKTIQEFDDAITIHSFGWASVEAYYAGSSSALSIPHVSVPLLCIQALDDPIAPKEAIPYQALAANPKTVLVTTPTGGHLGWVTLDNGATAEPWTDAPVMEWFHAVLEQLRDNGLPPPKSVKAVATVLGEPRQQLVPASVVTNPVLEPALVSQAVASSGQDTTYHRQAYDMLSQQAKDMQPAVAQLCLESSAQNVWTLPHNSVSTRENAHSISSSQDSSTGSEAAPFPAIPKELRIPASKSFSAAAPLHTASPTSSQCDASYIGDFELSRDASVSSSRTGMTAAAATTTFAAAPAVVSGSGSRSPALGTTGSPAAQLQVKVPSPQEVQAVHNDDDATSPVMEQAPSFSNFVNNVLMAVSSPARASNSNKAQGSPAIGDVNPATA